jgi:hypothetical protein
LWDRVVEEVRRLFIIFIYLWAMFALFILDETVILRQRGIMFSPRAGFAAINAIALAKVMLVADDLNVLRWVPKRPMIYRIVIESACMAVLFIGFNVLEHLVVGYFEHKTVATSLPVLGGEGLLGMICVAIIMFFAIMPFIACRHISRELGPGRLKAMLFETKVGNSG